MAMWVMAVVGGGAMPMLFQRLEPDHVAGTNLLDGATFVLGPTAARGDDEGLAERMRMPCGARARLEGDDGSGDKRGIGR